jgi:hypothetical protein
MTTEEEFLVTAKTLGRKLYMIGHPNVDFDEEAERHIDALAQKLLEDIKATEEEK